MPFLAAAAIAGVAAGVGAFAGGASLFSALVIGGISSALTATPNDLPARPRSPRESDA